MIEPMVSYVLGEHSITKLYYYPLFTMGQSLNYISQGGLELAIVLSSYDYTHKAVGLASSRFLVSR